MAIFAFISRHEPTKRQHELAEEQGITLEWAGDMDAFSVTPFEVLGHCGPVPGVVVVHPAAAMRLKDEFYVGVFENANRAEIGEKPQFEAVAFHVYGCSDWGETPPVQSESAPYVPNLLKKQAY